MNELGHGPWEKDYKPSGISRAKEAALKAYPINIQVTQLYGDWDINKTERDGFIKGYEQAEKDLALTIEDLELLHTFLYAVKNNKNGCFTFTRLSDEQYQEVLKRFKEARK